MNQQWQVEHSCECRDCCYLRCPRPCSCTPCCCPRNPVCAEDKQPKIVASILGYFKILRPKQEDDFTSLFNSNSNSCGGDAQNNCGRYSITYGNPEDENKYKGWTGRAMYNECKEQRDYKLRFTTSGLYGRGFNNFYGVLSPCRCGKKNCDCNCDLYCVCGNDKY